MTKKWIKLTDDYVNNLKQFAKRKVRLQNKPRQELWCLWDKTEKCFFYPATEDGFYWDEPNERPTHVLVYRK